MKQWFIIQDNNHEGPFTEEQIDTFWNKGEIDPSTQLWTEGMKHSANYIALFLTPPELPPLPQIENTDEASIDKPVTVAPVEQNSSSDLDLESLSVAVRSKVTQQKKEKPSAQQVKPRRYRGSILALGSLFISFGAALFSFFYYQNFMQDVSKPKLLNKREFARLKKAIHSSGAQNKVHLVLSKDKRSIFLGTNNPLEGQVDIRIQSIKKKILSDEEVLARASGELKNKLVHFKNFRFEKGEKLIDGHYSIKVFTQKDLRQNLMTSAFSSLPTKLSFEGQVLLSTMDEKTFAQQLKKFMARQRSNDYEFWRDLKEKYETLKTIAIKINDEIENVFVSGETKPWKEKVRVFETEYTTNYGIFFTNFVVANDKSYDYIKSKDFSNKTKVISEYAQLSRIAKSLGDKSMDVLYQLETFKPAKEIEAVEKLKNASIEKLSSLIDLCTSKSGFIDTMMTPGQE